MINGLFLCDLHNRYYFIADRYVTYLINSTRLFSGIILRNSFDAGIIIYILVYMIISEILVIKLPSFKHFGIRNLRIFTNKDSKVIFM